LIVDFEHTVFEECK